MPDVGKFIQAPIIFCEDPAGLPEVVLIGHDWIVSRMKRTEPSPNMAFRPPGCMLVAESIRAVVAASATLSHVFGG
jgi:hypothetical protein